MNDQSVDRINESIMRRGVCAGTRTLTSGKGETWRTAISHRNGVHARKRGGTRQFGRSLLTHPCDQLGGQTDSRGTRAQHGEKPLRQTVWRFDECDRRCVAEAQGSSRAAHREGASHQPQESLCDALWDSSRDCCVSPPHKQKLLLVLLVWLPAWRQSSPLRCRVQIPPWPPPLTVEVDDRME